MNLGVSQLPFLGFVVTGALTLLGKHLKFEREGLTRRTRARYFERRLPG